MGTKLAMQVEHLLALIAFSLFCQLTVRADETVRVRHRQAVAIGAGIATVTNLTTGATIGKPLRMRLAKIGGVGWRALGVALTATLFAPIVTALAKRQIATGFLNVGARETLRMRHRHPVTVGAELLVMASGATLNALLRCL